MILFETIDRSLFLLVNQRLQNPVFDLLMPWLSWNSFFVPALMAGFVWLTIRGGNRGRICALLLAVIVPLGDGFVINPIRKTIERPRPYSTLAETRTLGGRTSSYSFPSSHTANWFAGAVVVGAFWKRSLKVLLAVAMCVGFSRVYNGMPYPADVVAGAVLGSACGGGGVALAAWAWRRVARRWFHDWFRQMPCLLSPPGGPPLELIRRGITKGESDVIHTRLAYGLMAFLLLVRWAYLAAGKIELSEDEAYQWLWSKHLDISYYSKPPMIAYAQFLGTSLWGDTMFGVRFLSPLIGAVVSLMMFRFLRATVSARAGLWGVLATCAMPLMGVGSLLMTIDPLSVLFWTGGMVAGWHVIRCGEMKWWSLMGLFWGLGFLSKYTALFQVLCWVGFCGILKPARPLLRCRGFGVAIGILVLCTLPVLYWNANHGWITVIHLHARAGLDRTWTPSLRFLRDFVGSELGLLNPVFLVLMMASWRGAWRERDRDSLKFFLLAMGAPLFLGYFIYTFRARVQPNWIAPAVLPMVCLAVAWMEPRWDQSKRGFKRVVVGGFGVGLGCVILLHETRLIGKLTGAPLPPQLDPLRRVRGWSEMGAIVSRERKTLLTEGKPVLILGDHYGTTSLLAFYMPEAKRAEEGEGFVFFPVGETPVNQFYFWPGYRHKTGVNALFVQQVSEPGTAPDFIQKQFDSVTDIGLRPILYKGLVFRQIQIFACRGLKPL